MTKGDNREACSSSPSAQLKSRGVCGRGKNLEREIVRPVLHQEPLWEAASFRRSRVINITADWNKPLVCQLEHNELWGHDDSVKYKISIHLTLLNILTFTWESWSDLFSTFSHSLPRSAKLCAKIKKMMPENLKMLINTCLPSSSSSALQKKEKMKSTHTFTILSDVCIKDSTMIRIVITVHARHRLPVYDSCRKRYYFDGIPFSAHCTF